MGRKADKPGEGLKENETGYGIRKTQRRRETPRNGYRERHRKKGK